MNRTNGLATPPSAKADVKPERAAMSGERSPARFGDARSSALLDAIPVPLVESLRYLISRFQLGDHSKFPSRLAVVSALHGEGVTTISRTLATVVANDLGARVCWVDLSWRVTRPSGDSDRPQSVGLADVITGRADLNDAVQATDDPLLNVLNAGAVTHSQRESVARSPLLATVLGDLAQQFDCIILDVPPILAGSAGLGQLRHADAYLLVVRHGVTSIQQVKAATNELKSVPSIGVVLNKYESSIPKKLVHFFVS